MDSLQAVFMADHVGKCCECNTKSSLDSMVRWHGQKGCYYCIDCFVTENYDPVMHELKSELLQAKAIFEDEKPDKVARLWKWALG